MRKRVVLALVMLMAMACTGYVLLYKPDDAAFGYVAVGDDEKTVTLLMGQPRRIVHAGTLLPGVEVEYQYYFWPVPKVWCVGFRHHVVVSKSIVYSP